MGSSPPQTFAYYPAIHIQYERIPLVTAEPVQLPRGHVARSSAAFASLAVVVVAVVPVVAVVVVVVVIVVVVVALLPGCPIRSH